MKTSLDMTMKSARRAVVAPSVTRRSERASIVTGAASSGKENAAGGLRVSVPDVDGPMARLCWKQSETMVRCDRKAGHLGEHSWE